MVWPLEQFTHTGDNQQHKSRFELNKLYEQDYRSNARRILAGG